MDFTRNTNIFLLIVLALVGLSIWGVTQKEIQKGLDVQGGIRLTLEMQLETDEQRANREQIQHDLQRILENRVADSLGVVEASVRSSGTDRLIVEVPGYTDIEEAERVLSTTAKIQAYHAANVSTERMGNRKYSIAGDEESSDGTPFVAFTVRNQPGEIRPGDEAYAEMIEDWELILEGEELVDAQPQVTGNRTIPTFTFSDEGARKMEEWSRKYRDRGEHLAFVLDGVVLSIAPLAPGAIISDQAVIEGDFDPEYVNELTSLLKAGSLPVELERLESQQIDPTIGAQAFSQMLLAAVISFALICVFLIVYYAFPGVLAMIAMVLYGLFTYTVLTYIGATLSLAAFAGLILSMGMAVDANILVFERIKEEIKEGKSLAAAIDIGFKRALSAIIDSNACTIITSFVLFQFGTGPVKGFATALIIGVALSFFTAVTVTRTLLVAAVANGICADPKYFALNRNWFGEKYGIEGAAVFDIVSKSKKWFAISALFILPGLFFVAFGGIKPNIEFTGGYEAQFTLPDSWEERNTEVAARLADAGFDGSVVKYATLGDDRLIYVTVRPDAPGVEAVIGGNEVTEEEEGTLIKQELAEVVGVDIENSSFSVVGPTVAQETLRNAAYAVVLSSALIVLYLAIRFGIALGGFKNGVKFGICTVLALVHDVLFVIGMAGIFGYFLGWEVSSLFITAVLTVIGFSAHDTIIAFDRIREYLRRPNKGESFEHLVNRGITRTIARSINTSMIAMAPLVILIAFGTPTPDLKFFCLAMLGGIGIGVYSSIFVAAPILYSWDRAIGRRKGVEHTLLEEARREAKDRAKRRVVTQGDRLAPAAAGESYGQISRRKQAERPIDDDD